jgi:hypothetical protein
MQNKIKQNFFSIKFIVILICSFVAGLGTVPYGFRFANFLENKNHFLFLVVGSFFAAMSLFANMALGSYSLLNADLKQTLINRYYLSIGSVISAIPYGFIGYFGFKEYLPFFINLTISLMIVIVNTGIAYSAIYNFLADILKKSLKKISYDIKIVRQLGVFIGFLVSITIYVATSHGMTSLLVSITQKPRLAFYLGCIVAILSWLPFAALYANFTSVVSEKVYVFLAKNLLKITRLNKINVALIIIAIGSGASFAQIAIDFFQPAANIPLFFKDQLVQIFIYNFVIPCAFFSSAAVNYTALQRVILQFKIYS